MTDDFLFEQITKSASEETDRHKRLGAVIRSKIVTVSTVQPADDQPDETKLTAVSRDTQANQNAIMGFDCSGVHVNQTH